MEKGRMFTDAANSVRLRLHLFKVVRGMEDQETSSPRYARLGLSWAGSSGAGDQQIRKSNRSPAAGQSQSFDPLLSDR